LGRATNDDAHIASDGVGDADKPLVLVLVFPSVVIVMIYNCSVTGNN